MMSPRPFEAHEPNCPLRELDQRRSDGIEVTLLWNAKTKAVSVSVLEEPHAVLVQFEVAPSAALDAFHHPYAYAASAHHDTALAA